MNLFLEMSEFSELERIKKRKGFFVLWSSLIEQNYRMD